MQELLYLDRLEQAEALLKPQRVEVLHALAEPRSCAEVAERLDQTPQWAYCHVRRLVDAGLAARVSERRIRGIQEGVYQATAHAYRLSPGLVGRLGGPRPKDELSLGYVLSLVEEAQADLAALGRPAAPDLPSVGMAGEIRVRAEERPAFLADLQQALRQLFTRYGGADGDAFKLAVACYPTYPKEKATP